MNDKLSPQDIHGQNRLLETFSQALAREAHIVSRAPNLLWQQMHNGLLGEKAASKVLAKEHQKRSQSGHQPWLRLRFPIQRSQGLLRTLTGHTDRVNACAISPDGTWVASAGRDGALKIWDTLSGQVRLTLGRDSKEKNSVIDCAVNTDGRWIVSGHHDGKLRFWDSGSGTNLLTLQAHLGGVTGCCISPDGRWVISAGRDQHIKVWETTNGDLFKDLAMEEGDDLGGLPFAARGAVRLFLMRHKNSQTCALNPSGKWIVTGSDDGTLKIWDAPSGWALHRVNAYTGVFRDVGGMLLEGPQKVRASGYSHKLTACAISPDGTWTVSAIKENYTQNISDTHFSIHQILTSEILYVFNGHADRITDFVIHPNGEQIISASQDGTLKIWDLRLAKKNHPEYRRPKQKNHTQKIHTLQFTMDGSRFLSASQDKTLLWWDAEGRVISNAVSQPTNSDLAGLLSPDNRFIVTAGWNDTAFVIWDAQTGQVRHRLSGHADRFTAFAVSPDSAWLLSASDDRKLIVWDIISGKARVKLMGHQAKLTTCAISPDGRRVVSGSADGTLICWDAASGGQFFQIAAYEKAIQGCYFSPDGAQILSFSDTPKINVRDALSGQEVASFKGHTGTRMLSAVFTPDSRQIVSYAGDGSLKIWDSVTRERLRTIPARLNPKTRLVISPDGCWVAGCSGKALKLWHLRDNDQQCTLPLSGPAQCAAFHPWQPWVVCGDILGNISLISLEAIESCPVLLTPYGERGGLYVRCPACQEKHLVEHEELGSEVNCLTPDCDLRLKLNPFVIELS